MSSTIHLQNIQFNILDADTKLLIQKDFSVYLYPAAGSTFDPSNWLIKGGTDVLSNIPANNTTLTVGFSDEQLHSYGYSHAENPVVMGEFDDITGRYVWPWVINLYLKKLA